MGRGFSFGQRNALSTREETSMERFDIAVIGGGQGGLPAAHLAANLGAKVALIEMREVGGT
jgi:cation diffusion facilitator CzcD-associated flavoprotein CzcO